ncbi:MAG: hypothetical protein WDZ41_04660 [Candidatus Babeliales bacterium]
MKIWYRIAFLAITMTNSLKSEDYSTLSRELNGLLHNLTVLTNYLAIVKPKSFGLTKEQIAQFSPEQIKQSDDYLIKLLKSFGKPQANTFYQLKNALLNKCERLSRQGAYDQEFRFAQAHDPKELTERIDDFIRSRLDPIRTPINDYLNTINKQIQNGSIQKDFIALFKPWVLGSFADFENLLIEDGKQLIINFAAAIRYETKLDIRRLIPKNNLQAIGSDNQFVKAFTSDPKEKIALIDRLNLLRINPKYLKFEQLHEDLKKSGPIEIPTIDEAKKGAKLNVGIMQVFKKALEIELSTQGFIRKKIAPEMFTNEYLQHYMFDSNRFAPVRDELSRYLGVPIVRPTEVERQDFISYLEKLLKNEIYITKWKDLTKEKIKLIINYNDIINFFTAVATIPLASKTNLSWQYIRKKTNQSFDQQALKQLVSKLKILKPGDLAREIDALIERKMIPVYFLLSPEAIKKLQDLQEDLKDISLGDLQETRKKLNEVIKKYWIALYSEFALTLETLPIDQEAWNLYQTINSIER